jgi:hypothetical protein
MNLSAEKLDIIQRIIAIHDTDLLHLIKKLVSVPGATEQDWWTDISLAEKASINRGLADLNAGKVFSHEQIKNTYAKWVKD